VCNPLIDAFASFSFAICIIDIGWPTPLIAFRILQSLVLPFYAALLLKTPTTASLAAASQTLLLFVYCLAFCLAICLVICSTFRLANCLANCLAICLAICLAFHLAFRLANAGQELGTN
jgi:hypothetical protein